ncbi:MAG: carbohydrate binding domain-containing protein, partial [Paludibacter sp.]
LSDFFRTKYSGDATKIKSNYNLNGEEMVWSGALVPAMAQEDVMNLPGLTGAVGIASMVEGDQTWINNCYYTLVTMDAGTGSGNLTETNVNWGTDYFCDILKMQYLLIMTGNMPNPMGNYPSPTPTATWNILNPTYTATPIPAPGDFDNFETGVFHNLDTTGVGGGGTINVTNSTASVFEGTHSCKVVTTGGAGAWTLFKIDSPYDDGLGYKNYTGATKIEFDISAPTGSTFFIEIIESGANGGTEGETWSNRAYTTTISGTGWKHISINLTTAGNNPFGIDQYYTGSTDNNFDLKCCIEILKVFVIIQPKFLYQIYLGCFLLPYCLDNR